MSSAYSASMLVQAIEKTGIPCELVFASGKREKLGSGEPAFRVTFHTDQILRTGLDELSLANAYINGELDIDGDMSKLLSLRSKMTDKGKFSHFMKLWTAFLFVNRIRSNRNAIVDHYSFGDDFYLSYIDTKYRIYSQCIFHHDNETLEEAAEHKLESMYNALGLESGERLLDIGCGWGGVTEYCGSRGISVTGLTISEDSYNYTSNIIKSNGYTDCSVYLEDFLEHQPEQPYDGVVIYGVIEHLPYYRRFFQKVWDVLKPGGLFYLDASATIMKYSASNFTRRYIWRGPHSYMCLQDVIKEALYNGLQLLNVTDESHDYGLTLYHWASRLEAKKDEIIQKWGEKLYRTWRLYLWASSNAFYDGRGQAYHLVARRGEGPGPRPGFLQRSNMFIREHF